MNAETVAEALSALADQEFVRGLTLGAVGSLVLVATAALLLPLPGLPVSSQGKSDSPSANWDYRFEL